MGNSYAIHTVVLWVMVQHYNLVGEYQCFILTYCLHLQGRKCR